MLETTELVVDLTVDELLRTELLELETELVVLERDGLTVEVVLLLTELLEVVLLRTELLEVELLRTELLEVLLLRTELVEVVLLLTELLEEELLRTELLELERVEDVLERDVPVDEVVAVLVRLVTLEERDEELDESVDVLDRLVPVDDTELDVLLRELVGDTVLEVLERVEDGTEDVVDEVTVVYGGRTTALL